jgi:hypothetical protein
VKEIFDKDSHFYNTMSLLGAQYGLEQEKISDVILKKQKKTGE